MVKNGKIQQVSPFETIPNRELTSTVRLSEVIDAGFRLEASAFHIEARKAVEQLKNSGLPLTRLLGEPGLCQSAHNAFRFKRRWVSKEHGFPFLSSSDIISIRPVPKGYLSDKLSIKKSELIVSLWDVLISRSGTIGNIGLASASFVEKAVSEDVIRVSPNSPEDAGYIVAFLRGKFGRIQFYLTTYGSVVQHIEPEHLPRVLIPNLSPIKRSEIGRKVVQAYEWRDQANRLLDEADELIHQRLGLPVLSSSNAEGPTVRQVRASELNWRFEASYHNPQVAEAETLLSKCSIPVKVLSDDDVSAEIRPITKFRKRVYVETGGIPLLSSKQLFQIDPIDVKRLARGAHEKDLDEIALDKNMIAITCSGTIGKALIIPKYMQGWAANQHATRIVAANERNPGYIYAWLSSDYGKALITRFSYGSVILEIDKEMLGCVPIPIPTPKIENEIGDKVLKANELRTQAWEIEQEAIHQLERMIEKN